MRDLFGAQAAIEWDEAGFKGIARDGRPVAIEISVLTGRYVAALPLHGRELMTRRSAKSAAEARAAIEKAVEDSEGGQR